LGLFADAGRDASEDENPLVLAVVPPDSRKLSIFDATEIETTKSKISISAAAALATFFIAVSHRRIVKLLLKNLMIHDGNPFYVTYRRRFQKIIMLFAIIFLR
jgi:hypothetical protein